MSEFLKIMYLAVLHEVLALLSNPSTAQEVEQYADGAISLIVNLAPDGKLKEASKVALLALRAFEAKTTAVPAAPPVDPATLTDAQITSSLAGGES
jgi:hypothetical protein